jgi:putative transposase
VLVTVCSQGRRPLFARRSSVDAVVSAWRAEGQWIVGRYVFLPDHIHFFCAPDGIFQPDLNLWMRKWKARVSRGWPVATEHPIWQRGHWDRQLRSREHYDERWDYVRENPVRAGLCVSAEDWPWQGEVERLVL